MRVIHKFTAGLVAVGALLFVTLNMAGAVWAGIDLGARLPFPNSWDLAGYHFGAVILASFSIAMVMMKIITPFNIASQWGGGRCGASLVLVLAAILYISYSSIIVIIALLRLPPFQSVDLLDMIALAVAWLPLQ